MIKNHRTIPALNSSSQTHNYHVKKSGEMKKRKKIDCRSKGEKILNCKRESRRINDKFPPALIESLIDYQQKRRTENQQRMEKKKAIKYRKTKICNFLLLVSLLFARLFLSDFLLSLGSALSTHVVDRQWRHRHQHSTLNSNGHFFVFVFNSFRRSFAGLWLR